MSEKRLRVQEACIAAAIKILRAEEVIVPLIASIDGYKVSQLEKEVQVFATSANCVSSHLRGESGFSVEDSLTEVENITGNYTIVRNFIEKDKSVFVSLISRS